MNNMEQEKFNFYEEKVKPSGKLIITQRDLEIIRFCLEMRFATSEQIYRKFFKNTISGELSVSDRWTKERLCKLKLEGYLKDQKNFLTGQRLILATLKGYLLARTKLYCDELPRPLNSVDFRQFEHDKLLIDCRLKLEERQSIINWIGERLLNGHPELKQKFESETVPDACLVRPDGAHDFFELELTLKAKDRYRLKIKRYVNILRSEKKPFPNLKSTIFLCAKESIFKTLEKETKIYGSLFQVQMINNFMASI